jgi:antitoxin CptB
MNEYERKILWKCRRGMLELDLIFTQFFQEKFSQLTNEEKIVFEKLLDEFDPVLADWIWSGSNYPIDQQQEKFIKTYFKNKAINYNHRG